MDMGMDIHILPKERLVLLKDLIAIATIVNVKRDMYIVVDMAKEDTVRFNFFSCFFFCWHSNSSKIISFKYVKNIQTRSPSESV